MLVVGRAETPVEIAEAVAHLEQQQYISRASAQHFRDLQQVLLRVRLNNGLVGGASVAAQRVDICGDNIVPWPLREDVGEERVVSPTPSARAALSMPGPPPITSALLLLLLFS